MEEIFGEELTDRDYMNMDVPETRANGMRSLEGRWRGHLDKYGAMYHICWSSEQRDNSARRHFGYRPQTPMQPLD